MAATRLVVLSMVLGALAAWSTYQASALNLQSSKAILYAFLATVASCLSLLFLWMTTLRPSHQEGAISLLRQLYIAGTSSINGRRRLRDQKASWKDPRSAQEQFLMRILKENGDTDYGRKFDLKSIANSEEFRQRHPLTAYDHYKPYVERVMSGERRVMTEMMPNAFIVTSGTTGPSKYFPQRDHRASLYSVLDMFMANIHEICPRLGLLQKSLFHYVQPVISRSKGGGSIRSALSFYEEEDEWMASSFSTPPAGFRIKSFYQATYVHIMFALLDPNLGIVMAPFIGGIMGIMTLLESEWMNIVNDIEHGTINPKVTFEDHSIRSSLIQALGGGHPIRAGELRREFQKGFDGFMKRVWPNLEMITAVDNTGRWPELKAKYAKGVTFVNFGYGCSECILIAISPWSYEENRSMVFATNMAFFEFIRLEDSKESQPKTLRLDEVEVGKEYELVFTTDSGLYRYRVGDVIQITGHHQKTPTFKFMYRMGLILNLRYEKMNQVVLKKCLESAVEKLEGFNLVEYAVAESTLIPTSSSAYEVDEDMPYYVVFLQLDQISKTKDIKVASREVTILIDGELRHGNSDYERLRREGAISRPRVHIVKPGTFDALKQHVLSTTNTTANQYKVPRRLRTVNTLNFMFEHII